jgi:TMEM175 potassium channel family protein
MTLLVLDLRLPEEFHPHSAQELLNGLLGLWQKFFPYVLSFLVLGLRWLANVQLRTRSESFGREYARWWLFYLLLITCVPFTTMVVGRFVMFAPAIWLYAGNTLLIVAVAFRLLALTEVEPGDHRRDRQTALGILGLSSLLAIAWSFYSPRDALWAYLLNAAAPAIIRWR